MEEMQSFDVRYADTKRQWWVLTLGLLGFLAFAIVMMVGAVTLKSELDDRISWALAIGIVILPAVLFVWLLKRHGTARGRLDLTAEGWEFQSKQWSLACSSGVVRRSWHEVAGLTFNNTEECTMVILRMRQAPKGISIQLLDSSVPTRKAFNETWAQLARQASNRNSDMPALSEEPPKRSRFVVAAGWSGLAIFGALAVVVLFSDKTDLNAILRLLVLGTFVVPLAVRAIRR